MKSLDQLYVFITQPKTFIQTQTPTREFAGLCMAIVAISKLPFLGGLSMLTWALAWSVVAIIALFLVAVVLEITAQKMKHQPGAWPLLRWLMVSLLPLCLTSPLHQFLIASGLSGLSGAITIGIGLLCLYLQGLMIQRVYGISVSQTYGLCLRGLFGVLAIVMMGMMGIMGVLMIS